MSSDQIDEVINLILDLVLWIEVLNTRGISEWGNDFAIEIQYYHE